MGEWMKRLIEKLKHWLKYSKCVCPNCQQLVERSQVDYSIFCKLCEFTIRNKLAKVQKVAEILSSYATRFEIAEDITIEKRGEDLWCVSVFGKTVLDRGLNRHYEPLPSKRTEEFIAATQFSLEDAYTIAKRYEKLG